MSVTSYRRGLWVLLALAGALAGTGAVAVAADALPAGTKEPTVLKTAGAGGVDASFWLESSLRRVFPADSPGSAKLRLLAARNGKVAFQACLQNQSLRWLHARCSISGADDLKPQVRLVGLVPVHHFTAHTDPSELDGIGRLPGLVPDPLFPKNDVRLSSRETRSFWITLNIPDDAEPGERELKIRFAVNDGKESVELPLSLEVSPFVIRPRHDFPVTHWWRGETIWDYYKTGEFDERWWSLAQSYLENLHAHGTDVAYVPVLWMRREEFKRPCQLLIVNEPSPGKYEFDWSRVKRFTDLCRKIGFREFEWTHLWIYWGVENPIRIFKMEGGRHVRLWPPDISGFSETYVNFLRQFLPEFHKFLVKEDLLKGSYFHLSDEPGGGQHVENYRRARDILRELAPWMKTLDALSDIRYGKEGLTDMPIPMVSAAQAYIDAKIPHWVYYCCEPLGPWVNRFQDTPLPKIRMAGWLFYRLGAKGFLHWGFNCWHKSEGEELVDPFTDSTGGGAFPAGDPFQVYPGKDGPLDSIRWEVFAESLQDYAILQTAGINPDDPLLADVKTYADFPKKEEWLRKTLETVLRAKRPGAVPSQ